MRKSSHPTRNYLRGASRGPVAIATFREQMADYARGEKLRELREALRKSQEFVAHEIGVSTKTVRTWEAGGKIRWPNAQKIAAYYGCDPEELVSREIVEPAAANDGHVTLASLDEKVSETLSLLRDLVEAAAPELLQRLADAELGGREQAPARGRQAAMPKRSRSANG